MHKDYIECSCSNEVLQISYDEDDIYELYLSIYQYSHKVSFIQKLRYIWTILTKGHPYGDQMILCRDETKKLLISLHNYILKYNECIDKNKESRNIDNL